MDKKELKIKVVECDDKYFLIKRIFKLEMVKEYLICINYDFKTNTYADGVTSISLKSAYEIFNQLLLDKNFKFLNENNEELEQVV